MKDNDSQVTHAYKTSNSPIQMYGLITEQILNLLLQKYFLNSWLCPILCQTFHLNSRNPD